MIESHGDSPFVPIDGPYIAVQQVINVSLTMIECPRCRLGNGNRIGMRHE